MSAKIPFGNKYIPPISAGEYILVAMYCDGALIMKQFFALNFYQLAYWLGKCEMLCGEQKAECLISSVDKGKGILVDRISRVLEGCELLELRVSKCKAERLLEELQNQACTFGDISHGLRELHDRIFDELGTALFFHLSVAREPYFREPWLTFGQIVAIKFPAITRDIEEAGKCYGLKRNTACVFHLMRIMEHGLQELASQLNIETRGPSWDSILVKIDKELSKRYQDKGLVWIEREQYFAECASYLRAVKTAWRNPVMHVEDHYSDDETLSIYQTVQVFMKHLANNMGQDDKDEPK
jgi:hypothetical protein